MYVWLDKPYHFCKALSSPFIDFLRKMWYFFYMKLTGSLILARLRQAREDAHLSLEDAGKYLGHSGANVSRKEHGKIGTTDDELRKLARLYGKPYEWFLSQDIDTTPRPLDAILKEAQESYDRLEIVEIPIKGMVPAGYPSAEEERIEGYVSIPREQLGKASKGLFALRVSGDSLIGDDIMSNDLVIVDPTLPIINGNIYVVRLENEVVIRHVRKTDDSLELTSSNGKYQLIKATQVETLGGVILFGHWTKV